MIALRFADAPADSKPVATFSTWTRASQYGKDLAKTTGRAIRINTDDPNEIQPLETIIPAGRPDRRFNYLGS